MISFYGFSTQAIVFNNCSCFFINKPPLYFSRRIKVRGLRYLFIYIDIVAFLIFFSTLVFGFFTYFSKISFSNLRGPKNTFNLSPLDTFLN